MNSKSEVKTKYPFSIRGVYVSALLAGVSILFSLLLLQQEWQLFVYFILLTVLTTLIALELKIRLLLKDVEGPENFVEGENSVIRWRTLILLVFAMLIAISLPMYLATVLDQRIWFTLLTSFISGISISEIFFYLYCRKRKTNNSHSRKANQLLE